MPEITREIKLIIGTPAYHCQVHTEYVCSLLSFQRAGIPFSLHTIGNESLITRARNTLLSLFHAAGEYTHLLFLDGDVGLTVEGLERLLSHEVDVVGAQVPLKSIGEDGERTYNVGRFYEIDGLLARVEHIGTAVLLLSRNAVSALVAHAKAQNNVYTTSKQRTASNERAEQYDIFQVGVKSGVYLSEDYWVCHRLAALGFDIFVDISVKPTHHGMYTF